MAAPVFLTGTTSALVCVKIVSRLFTASEVGATTASYPARA